MLLIYADRKHWKRSLNFDYRKYFAFCSADRQTRSIYDVPGYKKHIYQFLNWYLFPVTRKSIFFKNLKTSFKSPPGGAGE